MPPWNDASSADSPLLDGQDGVPPGAARRWNTFTPRLDVHALITRGFRLEDGLAGARAMYGRSFQPAQALKALTWFQGGDLHELPLTVQKDLITAVAGVQDLPPIPETHSDLGGGGA